MSLFPVSPTNGQTTTVNGITYTYNSAQTAWIGTNVTSTSTFVVAGNINVSGPLTSGNLADAVGYKGTPINSKTSQYTLALSDIGSTISITTGGIIIPANSSVAFPIGSTVVVYNDSGIVQPISITTDTLRGAGTTSIGGGNLAAYGIATLLKVASTVWVASGNVVVGPVVNYLIVGGGGGGSGAGWYNTAGGGGGGGTVLSGTLVVGRTVSYSVVAGTGGGGGSGYGGRGTNGNSSSVFGITAPGGEGGSAFGGGGSGNPNGGNSVFTGGLASTTQSDPAGGGGGGAGSVGNNVTGVPGGGTETPTGGNYGGNGGAGISSSISGSSVSYGGGGGGGGILGAGTGNGGGGNGSSAAVGNGTGGAANRGGGGGGANYSDPVNASSTGGTGGSGVVIIAYPTGSMTATGGEITTSGGNTIHTFRSNMIASSIFIRTS